MGFEILFGCIDADKKSILPWGLKYFLVVLMLIKNQYYPGI